MAWSWMVASEYDRLVAVPSAYWKWTWMNWPGMKSSGCPSVGHYAFVRDDGASMRRETSLRGKCWMATDRCLEHSVARGMATGPPIIPAFAARPGRVASAVQVSAHVPDPVGHPGRRRAGR